MPFRDSASKTDVWVSAASGGLRVVALWDSHVITKKLESGGTYSLGRAADCDVRIDHSSVSRKHARIHVGDSIRIEDLGGANGTIVGRRRLAPSSTVEWTPGDLLVIGAATLFLQSADISRDELAPTAPAAATAWPTSGAMGRIAKVLSLVAPGEITVLLLGETGVGKELAAETVHRLSRRAARPFVRVNCAALPEPLLESELFGYERGAFTGADKRKIGFFEAADGATLFLDEIGDMPLTLQSKLLRVLERKVITRVGGTAEISADARVIAATHRDLEADVRAGRFRQDLLFRIAGFTLAVPPLRDRPTEIIPLAEHFVRLAAEEQSRPAPELSEDAREALAAYAWPGNVRELKNAVERALVLCGDQITCADLPDKLRDAGHRVRPVTRNSDVRGQLAEVERSAIVAALEAEGSNQTRAARRLGLSRRALIYKMEKHGLKEPPKP